MFFYRKTSSSDRVFNVLYNPLPQKTIDSWYRNVEEGTGRRYNKADVTGPGGAAKGNPFYEWNGISRYWRYSKERMQRLHDEGRLVYSKSGMTYEKRYLDASRGVSIQDLWDDVEMLRGLNATGERLGYPTQKPLTLLERIINASSNPGDVVLDPFCGCGTAVHAAEKLGRRWVGIDVTHLAISLVERRLKDAFPSIAFEVLGTPRDLSAARDKHQFQWWAVSLLDAVPQGGKKKGADRGIDGIRWVRTGPRDGDLDRVIISVKGGENVSVRDVRDLAGTVQREGALGGVLVTLADPTRPMLQDAAAHGYASTGLGQFRKIMVKTIAELMAGVHDDAERLPPIGRGEGFRAAPRERSSRPSQAGLFE
ncbi:MAG: DNA methyltransferase [Alphaproteobacteria bacterium]|nr:DNA methyltransferase [Alphaproteobacteria bacterium]